MDRTSFTPNELNDGFVVAITIEAKAGEAERVAAALAGLGAPPMAEPGGKLFLPDRSPTSPGLVFFYELYVDEAPWGAHQETAPFQARVKRFPPLGAKPGRKPLV